VDFTSLENTAKGVCLAGSRDRLKLWDKEEGKLGRSAGRKNSDELFTLSTICKRGERNKGEGVSAILKGGVPGKKEFRKKRSRRNGGGPLIGGVPPMRRREKP